MSGDAGRTVVDDLAARESAKEAWRESTLAAFRKALEHVDSDPERSLQLVRQVVEGWAHMVCATVDPGFKPYDGKELRREQLAPVLNRARGYWPADRRDVLTWLKNVGDDASHNQGHVQRSSPRAARAAVLMCVDILEWLFAEVLREAVPPDLTAAASAPAAGPRFGSNPGTAGGGAGQSAARRAPLAMVTVAGLAAALAAAAYFMSQRKTDASETVANAPSGEPKPGASTTPAAPSALPRARATASALLAEQAEQTLSAVRAYERAIASGDVKQILDRHRFPTAHWFAAKNLPREQVSKLYEAWFAKNKRRVTFEDCQVLSAGVARCQVRLDPVLEHHHDRVPTCLVFEPTGLLLSRTELDETSTCPP